MVTLDPETLSRKLLGAVDTALPRLRSIDEARSAQHGESGRWSPREELGHLIDSAANNHRRVVLGRTTGMLHFDGYDQNAWVDAHGYGDVPWSDLVELWVRLNRHMARAIARVPANTFTRPHADHSLGAIGVRSYEPGTPATLADLVDDYIEHLEHHLEAITHSAS